MKFPELPAADRIPAAELHGAVYRLVIGVGKWVYAADGVAELHAISADPRVLGHVMGIYLARVEQEGDYFEPAVVLLQMAGADEQVAQRMLLWQRYRWAKEQRTPTQFTTPGQRDG